MIIITGHDRYHKTRLLQAAGSPSGFSLGAQSVKQYRRAIRWAIEKELIKSCVEGGTVIYRLKEVNHV